MSTRVSLFYSQISPLNYRNMFIIVELHVLGFIFVINVRYAKYLNCFYLKTDIKTILSFWVL